ncbi:hypothetical protein [Bacteroides helcogenes]|uniref:Uncharacterized protein n=1 Tax=Bacteroides helcogenes (strain ATCC 35417 / DSM 20613 / JCM 6297 / CCUG 15421 / P 36-108) TaxID=693979 RepID=E6SWI8_BACT6|nr:hypothetical protein [Bacteroides helcogenes]ADV42586.1 hypothetical protein Bache_0561 [Bacteroides helcogenes P 36-108]MDY5237653.1 hypothetical protein [Bacteroides helcogenes]
MKKFLSFLVCISCVLFVMPSLLSQKNVVIGSEQYEMLLANVEALASGEGGLSKSESKDSDTSQKGPYWVTIRGQDTYAYRVVTVTNCFGLGVVDCTPGISEEWVSVN